VCNLVIGARNEKQLRENLEAVGWNLTKDQVARLDEVTEKMPVYPYWHQRGFAERIPRVVP
jgi:aryl-alcohol dehydrogenase-like predicted oxidoreductase